MKRGRDSVAKAAAAPSAFECPVCMELFDEVKRRPRVLECGHSLCGGCCEASAEARCPSCRRACRAGLSAQPPNYALLASLAEDGPLFHCARCERARLAADGWLLDGRPLCSPCLGRSGQPQAEAASLAELIRQETERRLALAQKLRSSLAGFESSLDRLKLALNAADEAASRHEGLAGLGPQLLLFTEREMALDSDYHEYSARGALAVSNNSAARSLLAGKGRAERQNFEKLVRDAEKSAAECAALAKSAEELAGPTVALASALDRIRSKEPS